MYTVYATQQETEWWRPASLSKAGLQALWWTICGPAEGGAALLLARIRIF